MSVNASKRILPSAQKAAEALGRPLSPSVKTIGVRPSNRPKNVTLLPSAAMRRVMVQRSYLTADECHGLADRLRVLGTNGAISSVFISRGTGKLSAVHAIDPQERERRMLDPINPHKIQDDLKGIDYAKLSPNKDDQHFALTGLQALTKACYTMKKAPVVTLFDGQVENGGFGMAMGRYVMVTDQTRFQINTAQRGLSLDPIGYSFVLNRLGKDYRKLSCSTMAMANAVALCGMQLNGSDMLAAGLATHYATEGQSLHSLLEYNLAHAKTHEAQRQWSDDRANFGQGPPKRRGGPPRPPTEPASPTYLPQDMYFDAAIESILDDLSKANAINKEFLACMGTKAPFMLMGEAVKVPLVEYATMLEDVLVRPSVEAMMDGLADRKSVV